MPLDPIRTVDSSTPVVVLKLDPNVFHHGGLGVIRSLGRWGVPVHVVHEDLLAPAAASRFVHGRWRWNPGSEHRERVQAGLIRIAERIGRRCVLITTDDAGAIFLAEQGDPLRRWFLFPEPHRDLPRRVADKESLAHLCRARAFPAPETARPPSLEEALGFVNRFGLPLVAKVASPWRRPEGSRLRSTMLVRTTGELAALFVRPDAATPLLLQEFIPGGRDADWFFHAYCDRRSVCRPGFTGVKLRAYPVRAGITTLGRTADNERLRCDIERLLAELGYRGLVDLDLRRDPRDGEYKLVDFNPRLGAQFRLFENTSGLDVVRAAYLDLTGQELPDGAAIPDRRFWVENYDMLAALAQYRRGELNAAGWARSLRGVDERAWFARDDLAPFGLMCLRFAWRALPGRRGRSHRPSAEPPRFRSGRAPRAGPETTDARDRVTTRWSSDAAPARRAA